MTKRDQNKNMPLAIFALRVAHDLTFSILLGPIRTNDEKRVLLAGR